MRRNIFLFKCLMFFNGLWLFSPLAVVYFEQVTNSYALAMLAFSLVNISQSLAEIPCGMFSDRISRKTTLILGSFFMLINMILWAVAGFFDAIWMLFSGSVLRGIGLALKSGTDTAMAYESLQEIKKSKLFNQIIAKIFSCYQLGALIAAFSATFITYYFSLHFLVCLAVIPFAANLIVTFLLVNPKNRFERGLSPKEQLKNSLTAFIKNKKLRSYALLQSFNSSILISAYRFEPSYYEQLVPLYYVNVARLLQHAMGWLSFQLVSLFNKIGLLKLFCYSVLGNSIIRFIGLIMNNPITPFFCSLQNLFYGINSASSTTLLQQQYSSALRATMASIVGLFNSIITALLGFIFGLMADIFSPRAILFIAAFGSLFLALKYHKLFLKKSGKK